MTFPQPPVRDVEQKLKDMDAVPLFMRSLPSEGEQSEALEALQALVYDGTPDEIAKNFKDQGNEYFREKRYREALGFYTQALDAKPTDPTLLEAVTLNKAACNLELKNFGSVLRDCSDVLKTNPQSLKAFYRSALALVALEKTAEAIDCCNRALLIDPDNAGINQALEKANNLKEKQERHERERIAKIKEQERQKRRLDQAFSARNIIVLPSSDPSTSDHQPTLTDAEDGGPPILSVPVIFLYPQYAQSDIISSFDEDTKFTDHLEIMFPPKGARPGWDLKGEYVVSDLHLYATTKQKRLLKIGRKMTLADLFQQSGTPTTGTTPDKNVKRDGLEMKEGYISVVVLPKGDVEQSWIDEFKKSRDS